MALSRAARRARAHDGIRHSATERTAAQYFARVAAAGLALPEVTTATRYDGTPVLKRRGAFMAGIASHSSTPPGTLVVRARFEERQLLLDEAPDSYYMTEYYRPHPVVLVRLDTIDDGTLRDVLLMSWRLTAEKIRARPRQ